MTIVEEIFLFKEELWNIFDSIKEPRLSPKGMLWPKSIGGEIPDISKNVWIS
jgi:hypothetical protein